MIVKNEKERAGIEKSGKILGELLQELKNKSKIGTKAEDLNQFAIKFLKERDASPAFLNFSPSGSEYPYPSAVCISINDEIVHGIPKDRVFKNGDIVSLDCGVKYNGYITDSAITIGIGEVTDKKKELISICKDALQEGIGEAKTGNKVGDIGYAISNYVKQFNFSIPKELGGHGVGKEVHEDPYISNTARKGTGEVLREGEVLAIEPMIIEGKNADIYLDADLYTYRSSSGKPSSHFEHTIIVSKDGGVVITKA